MSHSWLGWGLIPAHGLRAGVGWFPKRNWSGLWNGREGVGQAKNSKCPRLLALSAAHPEQLQHQRIQSPSCNRHRLFFCPVLPPLKKAPPSLKDCPSRRSTEFLLPSPQLLPKFGLGFCHLQSKSYNWEFPGSPVIKTLHFHCRGPGTIPGRGTKISKASRHGQKKKSYN